MFKRGESTNTIQRARIRKTVQFFTDREQFMKDLYQDIIRAKKFAEKQGLIPVFRFSGPAMIVAGILSDAQEMFAYNEPSASTIEEHRQLMNRAKWALFENVMKDAR